MVEPIRILTKEDLPEVVYMNLIAYRGGVDYDTVDLNTDFSQIKDDLFRLKPGKEGTKLTHFERVEILIPYSENVSSNEIPAINDNKVKEKKEHLLGQKDFSFHYLLESDIKQSYNDYFKDPDVNQDIIVKRLEAEISREKVESISGGIPEMLDVLVKSGDLSKIISSIELQDISPSRKFVQYLKKIVENDDLSLNLELKTEKSNELLEFDSIIRKIRSKYKLLKLDQQEIDATRKLLGTRNINAFLNRWNDEIVQKKVMISANFEINKTDRNFQLTYKHPYNNNILFFASLDSENFQPGWESQYSDLAGQNMKLNIFGQILTILDVQVPSQSDKKEVVKIKKIVIRTVAIW